MSIDPKTGRYCDACGRSIVKAVRVHQAKDYCRSCYQTNFVRVTCSACQQPMREHLRAAGEPICKACLRNTRTCHRCHKFTPSAAKLVGQSAVCNACAPYFREPRPCTSCGRLSTRLSRPLFAGLQDQVCDSCRNRLTHATCSTCRRYRPVALRAEDDTPYCKDCIPNHEVTHPCPECQVTVPGGGAARCRACTNRTSIGRVASLIAAELEADWTRILWSAFVSEQLGGDSSNPTLIKLVERAAEFFRALDRSFSVPQDVTAKTLTAEFDSFFLRKHLLASRFVVTFLKLEGFDEERELATECRRFEAILARTSSEKYGALLASYAAQLINEGTAARTSRLYVQAAEAFCAHAKFDGSVPWLESRMIAHLKVLNGQRANVARFVSYCRKNRGWDVRIPAENLWKNDSRKTQGQLQELRKALRATAGVPDGALSTRAVGRVLSLALDVPAAQLLRERDSGQVVVNDDGAIKVTEHAVLTADDPLYRYARRWADLSRRS